MPRVHENRRPTPRVRLLLPLLTPGLLFALGCAAPHAEQQRQLTTRLDEILNRNADSGAIYTARVIELKTGRELYSHNPDQPFTPASNMKLPISAAALDHFGPDHRCETRLYFYDDDLWIEGGGDPALGDPRLAKRRNEPITAVFDRWAAQLEARNIHEIPGDIIFDDSAFDAERTHDSWGNGVLYWYGAPVSGLNFNDNCIDVTITPTTPGEPVQVSVAPPTRNLRIINNCVTGDADAKHDPAIRKQPGAEVYEITGVCTQSDELASKPVDDPGAFFVDALRTHLEDQHGIYVRGDIRRGPALSQQTKGANQYLIAVAHTSMRDIIWRINVHSQNMFAEAMCKLLGRAWWANQSSEILPGSWSLGDQAVRAFLDRHDINHDGLNVVDGSGLSRDNRVTGRLISDLLVAMHHHKHADAFRDSLAIGGTRGTIARRFTDIPGEVYAKTGYIGGVRSLSGYVRTRDGEWLVFAIIYNQIKGSVRPYEALQDEAVRFLRGWPDQLRVEDQANDADAFATLHTTAQ